MEELSQARNSLPRNIARYTACHSEYPLDWERAQNNGKSQLGEEDECKEYWKAADRLMLTKLEDRVLQEEFMEAHKIIVDGKHCFRQEIFQDKGWCKITKESPPFRPHIGPPVPTEPSKKWGFCSSSCRVDYMKVNILSSDCVDEFSDY